MKKKIIAIFRQWLFGLLTFSISFTSYIPSQTIRNILYRYIFRIKMGNGVLIYGGGTFFYPFGVEIGDHSILGNNFFIDGRRGVKIGKNVNFSSNVSIYTLQHDVNDPLFGVIGGKVTIHDYAWISANTIILPNITIGKGAVVAAGAVVTKDVLDYTIVGGIPAKPIGIRTKELNYILGADGYIPFI